MDPLLQTQIVKSTSNALGVEALYMLVLGALTLLRGLGYIPKLWYRYALPVTGMLAGGLMLSLLFAEHFHDLYTTTPTATAFRPHIWIGIVSSTASLIALIGTQLRTVWLDVSSVIAVLIIGIIFLTQPQPGTSWAYAAIGATLLLSVFAHALATFNRPWYKPGTLAAGILLLLSAGLLLGIRN